MLCCIVIVPEDLGTGDRREKRNDNDFLMLPDKRIPTLKIKIAVEATLRLSVHGVSLWMLG